MSKGGPGNKQPDSEGKYEQIAGGSDWEEAGEDRKRLTVLECLTCNKSVDGRLLV